MVLAQANAEQLRAYIHTHSNLQVTYINIYTHLQTPMFLHVLAPQYRTESRADDRGLRPGRCRHIRGEAHSNVKKKLRSEDLAITISVC